MPDTQAKAAHTTGSRTYGVLFHDPNLGDTYGVVADDHGGRLLGEFYGEDAEGNARLDAAAPDLLDALTRDDTGYYDDLAHALDDIADDLEAAADSRIIDVLRSASDNISDALAKATGGTP